MKILIIGGGGREHALAWKLADDSSRPVVFCAPGNAGTALHGTNLNISAEDVDGILKWAAVNKPDLTVVGPEVPLCAGLVDRMAQAGLRAFGPCKAGALIEGSKVFSKEVMVAAGIPTAESRTFTNAGEALCYLRAGKIPVVVKAEGLAAGKGVYVCTRLDEAEKSIAEIMGQKIFGEAGDRVVIEEFLDGEEASMLALTDGTTIVALDSAQDHKRVFDNDEGPNTGGMGAYSPAPVVTKEILEITRKRVFEPLVAELKRRGIVYKGVIYAGLMLTKNGPKVLEFNCRFGDPETQAILPRIDGDLLPALSACVDGGLNESMIKWKSSHCICVVMAAGGYPGSYAKGTVIEGLADAAKGVDAVVFHAGTTLNGGSTVTSGGRVLGVTGLGSDLGQAARTAYECAAKIKFEGAHYRKDIGQRALRRQKGHQ